MKPEIESMRPIADKWNSYVKDSRTMEINKVPEVWFLEKKYTIFLILFTDMIFVVTLGMNKLFK